MTAAIIFVKLNMKVILTLGWEPKNKGGDTMAKKAVKKKVAKKKVAKKKKK